MILTMQVARSATLPTTNGNGTRNVTRARQDTTFVRIGSIGVGNKMHLVQCREVSICLDHISEFQVPGSRI